MGIAEIKSTKWIAHKVPYCGDQYQSVAAKYVLKKAVSKEILTKRGLVSISYYYASVHI